MAGDTPALLDGVIDSSHRSFLAVVQRVKFNVLRPRPPAEFIPVEPPKATGPAKASCGSPTPSWL